MGTFRSPLPSRGSPFFRDVDGTYTAQKFADEEVSFTWDLTDELGSDTISSVSYDAKNGLTLNSTSNTTTAVTIEVTETGYVDIEVTTAAGLVIKERFLWQGRDERKSDYRC